MENIQPLSLQVKIIRQVQAQEGHALKRSASHNALQPTNALQLMV